MKIISIDKNNIDSEHICCAIGNDKANKSRADSKKTWLKERFAEGLIFKRFDERGKIFIEYMPIETVWKPVVGKKYMFINCLWVSGQFKGKGLSTQLLDECINDAKEKKMNGVAVVSSVKAKSFLTDKKFYLKHGFETTDTAPPYFELLALKFNKNAASPEFSENAKTGMCKNKKGFTIIYSNQCTFNDEYVGLFADVLKKKGLESKVIKLKSCKEAQENSSPFGTLGIYFNGKLQTHELMPPAKFEKFVDGLL